MKRLIFIFLDGVGIGEPKDKNPFYIAKPDFLPFYRGHLHLPDNTPIKPIDPLLGVEGIPQSASGQTSLYTGENIPKILNQHKGSYPNKYMRKIIKEKNLLSRLKKKNRKAVFINAYPVYSEFFTAKHLQIRPSGELHFSETFPAMFKRRISVTSCMMVAALQTPFDEKDVQAEKTVFQEFSNRWLIEKGLQLPEFSPEKAAEILFQASRKQDFLLYEYFQTDLYAHRHNFDDQVELIKNLNRLVKKLVSLMDTQEDTLLITSDHGNLEDCSTKTHTLNPVPLLVWGNQNLQLRDDIDNLTDVTPAILKFLG